VQDSENRTALIWFLAKLALVSDEQIGSQVRNDDTVLELSKLLSGPGSECLDTISLAHVREEQAQRPGGRHCNDSADFRSIKILPTIDEFLCPADPYLPKASSEPMTTAQLLDRQFRLLREDIIGPAKEAQDDKRKLKRDLFEGIHASHVVTGEPVSINRNGEQVRVTGPSDPCICFSFQVPHWHRLNRLKTQSGKEQYWDTN
jgi:hypothetical protein